MRERRHYSNELKAKAVRMVVREGLNQPEAAGRLGIPKATRGNGIVAFKNSGPVVSRPGLTLMDSADVMRYLSEPKTEYDPQGMMISRNRKILLEKSTTGVRID